MIVLLCLILFYRRLEDLVKCVSKQIEVRQKGNICDVYKLTEMKSVFFKYIYNSESERRISRSILKKSL